MIKRFFIITFLLLFSVSVYADTVFKATFRGRTTYAVGNGGVPFTALRDFIVPIMATDYAAYVSGWGGFTGFKLPGQSAFYTQPLPIGNYVSFQIVYAAGARAENLVVLVDDMCAAQQPSSITYLSTIGSIDNLGHLFAADPRPSQQCNAGCLVTDATSGSLQCGAYLDPYEHRVVGAPVWITCTQGIAKTGDRCNTAPLATITGVSEPVTIPTRAVIDTGIIDDGNGDGGGSQDAEVLQEIASNTSAAKASTDNVVTVVGQGNSTLSNIASNQVTADQNADARHQETQSSLNGIKGLLEQIRDKPAGTGNFPSTVSIEGTADAGEGGSVVGLADPVYQTPEGGLQAPGEGNQGIAGLLAMRNNTFVRAEGDCPVWTIDLDYFGRSYLLDQHCTIYENNRATIQLIAGIMWTLMALFIVLSA